MYLAYEFFPNLFYKSFVFLLSVFPSVLVIPSMTLRSFRNPGHPLCLSHCRAPTSVSACPAAEQGRRQARRSPGRQRAGRRR